MNLHTKCNGGRQWTQTNVEYSYQYLVDASLHVADHMLKKYWIQPMTVLLPLLPTHSSKHHPGKTNGIVSIVKTNAGDYQWKNKFTRPDKTRLVIYELLLRDFLKQHDFNALTDTLDYLSSLGVQLLSSYRSASLKAMNHGDIIHHFMLLWINIMVLKTTWGDLSILVMAGNSGYPRYGTQPRHGDLPVGCVILG